jgi:hypothetical protein
MIGTQYPGAVVFFESFLNRLTDTFDVPHPIPEHPHENGNKEDHKNNGNSAYPILKI